MCPSGRGQDDRLCCHVGLPLQFLWKQEEGIMEGERGGGRRGEELGGEGRRGGGRDFVAFKMHRCLLNMFVQKLTLHILSCEPKHYRYTNLLQRG